LQTTAEGAAKPLSGEVLSSHAAAKTGKPVLEIENLSVQFRSSHGLVRAVENVGYTVYPGEMVAIVGESGSGKFPRSRSCGSSRRRPRSRPALLSLMAATS